LKQFSLLYFATQNLRRKRSRALIIGLCIAVASGFLFALTMLLRGVTTSLSLGQARLGADIVVVPRGNETLAQEAFITGQPTSFYMSQDIQSGLAELDGVQQVSPQVFVETLRNARCCIGEFFLIGFDPKSDFTISPWIANHSLGSELGAFDIIAGDRILLREGDDVTFFGTSFSVVGVLERTGMGIDRTIYVPMEGLRKMVAQSGESAEVALDIGEDQISSVLVRVERDTEILDVAEAIEEAYPGTDVFTASQLNQSVGAQMQGVLVVTAIATAALWLMALITMGLVFSLMVNERQRELGLLRAMGARRDFIFRLVTIEAGLLSVIGGAVGILGANLLLMLAAWLVRARLIQSAYPSTALSRFIQLRLRLPFMLPDLPEIIGIDALLLVLAALAGIVAALQPAFRSSRMEPYLAIRQGE